MSRDFPVTGLAETLNALTQLGPKIEKQAIRAGLTAAAAEVRAEARLRAPRKTGKLAKSIKSGNPRKNQDGSYSITVGPRGKDHAFLGLFFEFGVAPHFISAKGEDIKVGGVKLSARQTTKKALREGAYSDVATQALKIGDNYVTGGVMHPGITARPFMRPALDAKAEEAVAALRDRIIAVVENKTGFNIAAGFDEAA